MRPKITNGMNVNRSLRICAPVLTTQFCTRRNSYIVVPNINPNVLKERTTLKEGQYCTTIAEQPKGELRPSFENDETLVFIAHSTRSDNNAGSSV